MFEVFDNNKDGYIDRDEFKFCWNNWIKTVSNEYTAVLLNSFKQDNRAFDLCH